MKIAVLGTGPVGQTISEKLNQLGHDVTIGTRNLEDALARTGKDHFDRPAFGQWHKNNKDIKVATNSEAVKFGELIINATNGAGSLSTLIEAGKDNLSNKILLDIANPLDFSNGMPPSLSICNNDSLAEQIQREFPETKVVKSLNTLTANLMVNPKLLPEPTNIFLNGNDTEAKTEIKKLLISFGWRDEYIIDMGDITTARGTEQLLPIWVRLWNTFQNPIFNFKIVKSK